MIAHQHAAAVIRRLTPLSALASIALAWARVSAADSASAPAPAGEPPPTPPAVRSESATAPDAAARLQRLGSTGLRIHDPSSIVSSNGEYWLFGTGPGVQSYRSKDLRNWERGPRAFEQPPAWIRDAVPANRNGNDFWAPDVIRVGERYLLYYSVSSWGKNASVIALASNRTLDPENPDYRWTDEGIVIRSTPGTDDFNAIDPAATLDADGNLWLSFGSFWGGIMLVQLDPKTGLRIAPDSPIHPLAKKDQIEAPSIHRHGRHYYLFVNWGLCCRGVNSTYNIRVGRSERITGPYLDKDGKDMRRGGGTLLLGSEGPFVGPGHPSIFVEGDRQWLAVHFYDATNRGRGTLALRPLTWDADGWPVVGVEPPNP